MLNKKFFLLSTMFFLTNVPIFGMVNKPNKKRAVKGKTSCLEKLPDEIFYFEIFDKYLDLANLYSLFLCNRYFEKRVRIYLNQKFKCSINLSDTKITDKQLEILAKLQKNITKLDLSFCTELTSKTFELLGEFKKISVLLLLQCQINDSVIKIIVDNLKDLEELNISYCYKISDKGFKLLKNLPKLKKLSVTSCKNITEETIEMLKTNLTKLVDFNHDFCIDKNDDW